MLEFYRKFYDFIDGRPDTYPGEWVIDGHGDGWLGGPRILVSKS